MSLHLEDFGTVASMSAPAAASPPPAEAPTPEATDYDTAYNAGWDDAIAQVETEQGRIAAVLGERLAEIAETRSAALETALRTLEPVLADIFDKVLPHAVERTFLPLLLQEAEALARDESGPLILHVAPEQAGALENLVAARPDLPVPVRVRAEPALSLSQALVSWERGERRMDLDAVLGALDDALQGFMTQFDTQNIDHKEAANG
jgi:flagellar assembly protein FliH